MVTWTNDDGTQIQWPDEMAVPTKSLTGNKAVKISGPVTGHIQRLEAGSGGTLTFEHPTDYVATARIREFVQTHSSFGAMFNAVIEFD